MPPLSQTSSPRLLSWGARALYVGPSFALSAHRNAVAVLAVALERPLRVAHDPRRPARSFTRCRTALIEPSQLHLLECEGTMAFLYLDARSTELDALRRRFTRTGRGVHFGLRGERRLIDVLRGNWSEEALSAVLPLEGKPNGRMAEVIDLLLAAPAEPLRAADLAMRCGLSPSRFQHAFKEATGVAFRRFRTWARMRAVMQAVARGSNFTEAALDAGFSSSAHFSAAFRQMFGVAPSRLLPLSGAR
jgi:AraC-like DNA-binding protein